MSKQDLQMVKKIGSGTLPPETLWWAPYLFQPLDNLTAQVDPRITLRQDQGWRESNIEGDRKG